VDVVDEGLTAAPPNEISHAASFFPGHRSRTAETIAATSRRSSQPNVVVSSPSRLAIASRVGPAPVDELRRRDPVQRGVHAHEHGEDHEGDARSFPMRFLRQASMKIGFGEVQDGALMIACKSYE
jgi:hypothetical protein